MWVCIGEKTKACRVFVRNTKLNKILGKTRRRRTDDIKSGLKEMGWEGVDWIHMAQDSSTGLAVVSYLVSYLISQLASSMWDI